MRVVIRRTGDDTGGRAVVFEMFVPPGEHGFAMHVHPRQEERVDVLHGTIAFRIGRRRWSLGPGGRIAVPAGAAHGFRNVGEGVAHVVCELRPALRFDEVLEAGFSPAVANARFDRVRAALVRVTRGRTGAPGGR